MRWLQSFPAGVTLTAAIVILTAGLALRPALAIGGSAQVGPFAIVHCTSTSPCQTYSNQGQGSGLEGVNTNNNKGGVGIEGVAKGGGMGVYGSSKTNVGVSGYSTSSAGVSGGTGSGWSVLGTTTDGIGVYGDSVDSNGGFFESEGSTALVAAGYGGYGIQSVAETDSAAIDAMGIDDAIDATSVDTSGYVISAVNDANEAGSGTFSSGYDIGAVDESSEFPWLSDNASGTDENYTDAEGDFYYAGMLIGSSKTRDGNVVIAYSPKSTSPTIEDDGTAHLVDGMAVVRLGKPFADAIDSGHAYHVMLTPDGDTRGLYVAAKSPTQFVVREVQGGRGSLDFDYHIYASQAGAAGVQMAEMTQAQLIAREPHAPAVKLSAIRPKIHTKAGIVQL